VDTEKKHHERHERDKRERTLDKTIADSFPTSDPPSTIPNPATEEPGPAKEDDEKSCRTRSTK
jgi:hypothetical protein